MRLITDTMFRNFFGNEKNKLFLSCLLSELLNLDYKYILRNIKYLNTYLCKDTVLSSSSIVDVLVQIDNIIIDIEAYTQYSAFSKLKNMNYISKIYIKNYNGNDGYHSNIRILQVNFIKSRKIDSSYQMQNKNALYIDKIRIIDLHIDNLCSNVYTNNKQINIWKRLLNGEYNAEEVFNIIDEFEYDSTIKNKMKGLISEFMTEKDVLEIGTTLDEWIKWRLYTAKYQGVEIGKFFGRKEGLSLGREEGLNLGRKEGFNLGREEGFNLGRQEGFNRGIKNGKNQSNYIIAKKLLERNMNFDEVSEITGINREKIEDLSLKIQKISLNND